jgi:hypothetical protein
VDESDVAEGAEVVLVLVLAADAFDRIVGNGDVNANDTESELVSSKRIGRRVVMVMRQ